MAAFITDAFIEDLIRSGRLTEARLRHEAGTADPEPWNVGAQTCWSLVCEEVIDTDHEPGGYDAVYGELVKRGFTSDEIDEMRRLSWRTAGWLNYEKMLWDWVYLDEEDIRRALEWQEREGIIGKQEREETLTVVQGFLDRDPPITPLKFGKDA